MGQNYFLAKTDVKNAVRSILIRPEDYDLLGIYWQGLYYYDGLLKQVPVSRTFERFSTALEWITQNKLHISYILHLLEDFLIISSSKESHNISWIPF